MRQRKRTQKAALPLPRQTATVDTGQMRTTSQQNRIIYPDLEVGSTEKMKIKKYCIFSEKEKKKLLTNIKMS